MIETKYLFNPLSPHIKRGKQQPLKIKNPSPHSNHLPHPPPLSPHPQSPLAPPWAAKSANSMRLLPSLPTAHCPDLVD